MTGRMLIAGVGNIFLGDDGFGVEVASRLAKEALRRRIADDPILTEALKSEVES